MSQNGSFNLFMATGPEEKLALFTSSECRHTHIRSEDQTSHTSKLVYDICSLTITLQQVSKKIFYE